MSVSALASTLVMVVEDDQDIREAICNVLVDAGYTTVAFRDPLDGLDYLASDGPRPLLILLDLMLPGMLLFSPVLDSNCRTRVI